MTSFPSMMFEYLFWYRELTNIPRVVRFAVLILNWLFLDKMGKVFGLCTNLYLVCMRQADLRSLTDGHVIFWINHIRFANIGWLRKKDRKIGSHEKTLNGIHSFNDVSINWYNSCIYHALDFHFDSFKYGLFNLTEHFIGQHLLIRMTSG